MARVAPLLGFLGLWYAFNAAFNVQNKVILNKFPYPWAASWFQLASGILFFVPAWLPVLGPRQANPLARNNISHRHNTRAFQSLTLVREPGAATAAETVLQPSLPPSSSTAQ